MASDSRPSPLDTSLSPKPHHTAIEASPATSIFGQTVTYNALVRRASVLSDNCTTDFTQGTPKEPITGEVVFKLKTNRPYGKPVPLQDSGHQRGGLLQAVNFPDHFVWQWLRRRFDFDPFDIDRGACRRRHSLATPCIAPAAGLGTPKKWRRPPLLSL